MWMSMNVYEGVSEFVCVHLCEFVCVRVNVGGVCMTVRVCTCVSMRGCECVDRLLQGVSNIRWCPLNGILLRIPEPA